MRYFTVFLFIFCSSFSFGQNDSLATIIQGTVLHSQTRLPMNNVHVINTTKVKGTITDGNGFFQLTAKANDTLLFSYLGFETIKVKVTNDWIKNKTSKITLTEKAYALEEVVISKYNLTGYIEVDTKLIPTRENYSYSISGLTKSYELGERSPNAFSRVMSSIFNPADLLYNFFGNKPKELRKLREMRKDDTVRNLLETKFDRETIAVLLGIDKNEIPEILSHCNYSKQFIETANDLQIMDALSGCYEEYKILTKKHQKYVKE